MEEHIDNMYQYLFENEIKIIIETSLKKIYTKVIDMKTTEYYIKNKKEFDNRILNNSTSEYKTEVLYHGTSHENIKLIGKEGFDFTKIGTTTDKSTTGSLGHGMYCTDNPSCAYEKYSKANDTKNRYIIVCITFPGRIYHCDTFWDKDKLEPGYDSHRGNEGCHDVKQTVYFKQEQIIPLYIVQLKEPNDDNYP